MLRLPLSVMTSSVPGQKPGVLRGIAGDSDGVGSAFIVLVGVEAVARVVTDADLLKPDL